VPGIDYGLDLPEKPICPVNPSGGLIACGHPVGATGLMQGVLLSGNCKARLPNISRVLSCNSQTPGAAPFTATAGTGTYVTVSILERAK